MTKKRFKKLMRALMTEQYLYNRTLPIAGFYRGLGEDIRKAGYEAPYQLLYNDYKRIWEETKILKGLNRMEDEAEFQRRLEQLESQKI